jgi:hypothetical protein
LNWSGAVLLTLGGCDSCRPSGHGANGGWQAIRTKVQDDVRETIVIEVVLIVPAQLAVLDISCQLWQGHGQFVRAVLFHVDEAYVGWRGSNAKFCT